MNKKQWVILIVGIICIIIFISIAVSSKPYRSDSNIFWTAKMYTSDSGFGVEYTHWTHSFSYVAFIVTLFIIGGFFGFLMWISRTREEKIPIEKPDRKITIKESEKQETSKKDFIEELKELAALKEKGLISEEEFNKAKEKLFEDNQ